MKISKTSRDLAEQLKDPKFVTTIYVDKDGDPVLIASWSRDIIVSKILVESKEK